MEVSHDKGQFFPFSSSFSEQPWSYHYVIIVQNETENDVRLHLWHQNPGSWLVGRIGNLIKARERKKIAIPDWMWHGGGGRWRVLNHIQNHAINYAIEDTNFMKMGYTHTGKIQPWKTISICSAEAGSLHSNVGTTLSWSEFIREEHPDYSERYLIRIINKRPFVLGADIFYPEDKGHFPIYVQKSSLYGNKKSKHEVQFPCGIYGTWVMKNGGHVELMIPNLAYRKNNKEMDRIGRKPLRLTVKRDRKSELDDIIEGSITVSPYTEIIADEFSKVFLGLKLDVFPKTVIEEIAVYLEGTTILVKSNIEQSI